MAGCGHQGPKHGAVSKVLFLFSKGREALMLILSRTPSQRIIIRIPERDEPIVIEAVRIGCGKVYFGFEADDDILINREEVDARMEVAA